MLLNMTRDVFEPITALNLTVESFRGDNVTGSRDLVTPAARGSGFGSSSFPIWSALPI